MFEVRNGELSINSTSTEKLFPRVAKVHTISIASHSSDESVGQWISYIRQIPDKA